MDFLSFFSIETILELIINLNAAFMFVLMLLINHLGKIPELLHKITDLLKDYV